MNFNALNAEDSKIYPAIKKKTVAPEIETFAS